MSDVTKALKSLENQIGITSGSGNPEIIHQNQRSNVISWLTIKGVWNLGPRTSNETLGKMYGIPNYLSKVLYEQKLGKNKYERKISPLNFSTEAEVEFEPDLDPESTPSNLSPQNWGPDNEEIENKNELLKNPYSLNSSKIKPLIESIVRDTIFRAINKEITDQRIKQNQDNKNFQDAIIKTVHEGVNTTLQNALKANRDDAIKIAEETVKHETQIQTENLKKQVEGIIFDAYLKQRVNSITEPLSSSKEEIIPEQDNSFIPKIDKNYYFDPYAIKVIRSALSMQENLYVYGDTGCGKTTHLEQVCGVLNRGIIRINPHDGITREMFLGGMKLINNETIFVEGALPLAMKNGYVFLVDEISFLPHNLTAILNPVGEKGGKLYIPETSEWITPSLGFCIFATDNTGGKGDRTGNYTGTEVQNTATLDRFAFCLKMDYLPQEKEKEMLIKRFTNQSEIEIEKMLKFATDIRSAFSRGELSITFSTRKLIKFFDQREYGFSISESLSNTILSWLDEDDENLVKTMIDRLDLLSSEIKVQSYDFDLSSFREEIVEERIVSAIRILRTLKPGLGLKEAKDIAESYRDGLISLDEVEQKIKSF